MVDRTRVLYDEQQHTHRATTHLWSKLPFWPFRCRARSEWGHRCELKPAHVEYPCTSNHLVARGMDVYEFTGQGAP